MFVEKTPKVIFFDLDETLIRNVEPIQLVFRNVFYSVLQDLGESTWRKIYADFGATAPQLWKGILQQAASPEVVLQSAFASLIKRHSALSKSDSNRLAGALYAAFLVYTAKNVQLHDDALTTLKHIRENGIGVGIITNGIEEIQQTKLGAVELHSHVDHITISAHARAHKPHAGVFELALQRSGEAAHNAWMVGDHPLNDIVGAQRVGVGGIFYNPSKEDVEEVFADHEMRPSLIIHSLFELIDRLHS